MRILTTKGMIDLKEGTKIKILREETTIDSVADPVKNIVIADGGEKPDVYKDPVEFKMEPPFLKEAEKDENGKYPFEPGYIKKDDEDKKEESYKNKIYSLPEDCKIDGKIYKKGTKFQYLDK